LPGGTPQDAPPEDLTAQDWYTAPMATTATPAPPPPAPAFAPIVTAILLVGGGGLWLLDSLGAVEVGWRGATAVGLVLVGVTLVVATWWGRAAGLIPLAVLLATVLVVDDAVAVPIDAGIGDRTVVVTTSEEVEDHQQLLMGDLTVDLTHVPAQSGSTQDVEVSVGIGQMQVIVPRDATVTADTTIRAGEVAWPGRPDVNRESGVDVDRSFGLSPLGGATGGPRLHLDLSMGLGNVEVVRG
jgi:hypothetical protein